MSDRFIGIFVAVALFEMMAAVGLTITTAEILETLRRWTIVLAAGLANYAAVPALTILLLLAFDAEPMVAAGFLILAVCPGAPFAPSIAAAARGNVAASAALMALLAASSAVLAPLLLGLLLPLVSGDRALAVNTGQIVRVLFVSQLLPLALGLLLHAWRPRIAAALRHPATVLSRVLIAVAVVLVLTAHFKLLAQIHARGYAGMALLVVVSLAAGWIAGGRESEMRRTLAITTSLRNAGVALAIAVSAFAGTAAATAVVAYLFVEIVGALLAAAWWSRHPRATPRAMAVAGRV